jgi:hypothetical protein
LSNKSADLVSYINFASPGITISSKILPSTW